MQNADDFQRLSADAEENDVTAFGDNPAAGEELLPKAMAGWVATDGLGKRPCWVDEVTLFGCC